MEFLYFVSICVFIVLFINMNNKIRNLKEQNNFLNRQIRDLSDKILFTYEQLKKLQNSRHEQEKQKSAAKAAVETQVQNVRQENNVFSVAQIENAPTIPNSEPVVNMAVKTERQSVISPLTANPYAVSKNVQKPVSTQTAVHQSTQVQNSSVQKNISQNGVVQNSMPHVDRSKTNNPNTPNPVMRNMKRPVEKPQLKSFENWLGTRLFNVAASLMIFIGLILFCTLGYEYITDTMKIAAMFIVSGSFIALGAFFTRQNKSIFSLGLTGCGFGAFFISILLSHIYFHAITDIAAFGLLLIWASLALYMSKKLDSVMLSVTAHMGTAISICFAFSLDFSAERIILPVAYQLVSIAVIVLGNIFCCKKTYRFGLFMSMSLLVYTSIVMCSTFSPVTVMPGEVSPMFTAGIFIIQLLAMSFVSYLISVSTALLENENIKYKELPYIAHIANKVLWTAGTITIAGCVTFFIERNVYNINSIIYPTFAICITAICHLIVTLFMSEKLNFSERLSKISIWFISVMVMIVLFIQCVEREILHGVSFLFVYTGLIMLIIRYTKNKKLNHLVSFLIGCDMLFMCLYGYFAAANVVISIAYMVVIGLMILLHWFSQSGEGREKYFTLFKTAEYIWISASIIPINASDFSDISLPLILSEFALMNIIAFLCRYGRDNEPGLKLLVKIESLSTIYISIFFVAFFDIGILGNVLVIKIIFVILSAILTALYVYDFMRYESTGMQVISAGTAAGYLTALHIGLTLNLANPYIRILVAKRMSFPFFFLAAVMLVVIYRYNKNHKLRAFIWTSLGIDMTFKLCWGYMNMILMKIEGLIFPGTRFLSTVVCIIHASIITFMIYCLWKLQSEEQKPSTLSRVKLVAYFWVSVSAAVITFLASLSSGKIPNSDELVFLVLTLINIAVYASKYNVDENVFVNKTIKVTSTIVLYISIIMMATYISVNANEFTIRYLIRFALILSAVGLYYLIAREFIKSKSPWVHACVGLTATLIVNAVCRGLSTIFEIAYIFSIVTMITALICIAVGFAAKTKGLRVYGLIVVMLCVLKLVTIDISGADSMSRVVAFIVGGIVCFIISGIYNKVESKLIKSEEAGR